MIKNNFRMPEAYASPAIKVVQINSRRVMCQSPDFGGANEAGAIITEDENDIHSY